VTRGLLLLLLGLCVPAAVGAESATGTEPPLVTIDSPETWVYPQRREIGAYSLVIHAPQIRSWPQFERIESVVAVELTPPDGSAPRLGTITITGATEVDLDARMVKVIAPTVSDVHFSDDATDTYVQVVEDMATREELDVPLDLFLASLADDVLSDPPPPGFNSEPPAIVVASKPTLLLFVNGPPVLAELSGTGLRVVANANWPTFKDPSGKGTYYLLYRDLWLTSSALERGWKKAKSLPAGFERLPPDQGHEAVREAVPLKASTLAMPKVVFADRPTELIVTEGKAKLEAIPGADGLSYVTNTESPLFLLEQDWYYLVAGRWFTTTHLEKGPWTYAAELPAMFEAIPDDHVRGSVRASVPGTIEARMAALEALLPTRRESALDAPPPVEVSYAGEPKFEPVQGTEVARAVNSGYDIIQYQGQYYLCYAGVWYQANSPVGPWNATASVPAAIYAIPPSSPAYNVTQVKVVESTPTTVVYSYPPAYSSSVYVVYGVPYYGTGWYYPPYVYGGYYYPYWGSYGHGSWYNPATGGYGSRSVWYGPYGGYSYTQGYNPTTGRYGYVETAWDGDSWAGHGQTYNPRTGVGTETIRSYDADSNRAEMGRTVQRGDQWIQTERDTDFDSRVSNVGRQTSGGGSTNTVRSWDDGTMTTSGTITTGDGRTATISGEQTRAGGSSTITGEQGSVDFDTRRNDGRSVTGIEGSEGGSGVSVSGQGPGRTTIGQSGSGDLYAGHNGSVYKKTDEGWQHYENGGWQQVDAPERPRSDPAGAQTTSARAEPADYSRQLEQARAQARQREGGAGAYGSGRDFSQLDRDHLARQRGTQQFQRRAGGYQQGALQRGQRMGGGGRRR